jgi:di/tricarboxylate transporter
MLDAIGAWVETYQAYIALLILAFMIAAFVAERVPPVTVAVIGAAACFVFGLIPEEDALKAFSNTAPITIAALFILTSALERTGVLNRLGRKVVELASRSGLLSLIVVAVATLILSAFVNNTAVVIVLIPIVVLLAEKLGIAKRKLLIPLSYLSIIGGTLTLIGTSTNLIVAGVATRAGIEPFSIFEISGVGLAVIAAGAGGLLLLGPFLLPDGSRPERKAEKPLLFLTDLAVPANGEEDEKWHPTPAALKMQGLRIVSLTRATGEGQGEDEELMAGDKLSVRVPLEELLTLIEEGKFNSGLSRRSRSDDTAQVTVQGMLAPNDPNVGRRADQLSYLSTDPIIVRGIARHGNQPGPQLASTHLRAGDLLLLDGDQAAIDRLVDSTSLIIDHDIAALPYRRESAGLAVLTIIAVVVGAAMGVAPLAVAAFIGVGFVLLMGCMTIDDAWRVLDGGVLGLIIAMLIVGAAMQESGAVDLIVQASLPVFTHLSPFLALIAIYFLTSFLTEIVTNAAVAVILTPIVIGLAGQIGVEPRALVVAVMFAASASFASPVGYQTNTLVYAAGDYRFADFLRIGLPMNVIVGMATCTAIAFFYQI